MSRNGKSPSQGAWRTAGARWAKNAHPFFWLLFLPVLPAIGAAVFADGGSPKYALESAWVYRLEVGLAFYFGLLIFCLTLYLGYYGHTFRRLELPGGPAVEPPDPAGLDRAAEGFDEFKQETKDALAEHEDALNDLDDRLAIVENEEERRLWSRMRRVISRT